MPIGECSGHLPARPWKVLRPLPDLADPQRFPAAAGPVADADARAAWEAMAPADQEQVNDVLDHYNQAPAPPAGHSELVPLELTEQELAQLEAFLRTLSGAVQAPGLECVGCHP